MTPEQRTAIYAAVPAIAAVLVVYGYVTEEQAATIVAAVVAILGVLVAFVNRPTKTEG
ncbi:MAG: hypothetical protein KC544_15205 [Gemmatimonadetes bacterium]|nr:hypothetical protein [Gemmatimonadota bacterium]MCB9376755.1 hypothetical protein [Microthrixaceae bacterium]